MRKRKILITGATGFIGRNVTEAFVRRGDFEVHGTFLRERSHDLSGVQLHRADLTKKEDAERVVQGMDVVFHAAAVTSGTKDVFTAPHIHITDNVVMSSLLIRAAFDHKVPHFVFPSCSTMYASSDRPLLETDYDANRKMIPQYFGGGSMKVYLEKMCEFFSRLGGTRFTTIRHSNAYGPYDKYDLEKSHVFGATVAKVMTTPAEKGEVLVWGDGSETRDFLHVSDLAAYVEAAVEKQNTPYECHNVGSGAAVSVAELVRKVIAASGRPLRIVFDPSKPTIKTGFCLDSTQAREKFGWAPRVPLDDGIRLTLDWYRANVKL